MSFGVPAGAPFGACTGCDLGCMFSPEMVSSLSDIAVDRHRQLSKQRPLAAGMNDYSERRCRLIGHHHSVRRPSGVPEWLNAFTAAERPDLWGAVCEEQLFRDVWPEYNQHGSQSPRYFGQLVPRFAHLQILFLDERSRLVVARGRTSPSGGTEPSKTFLPGSTRSACEAWTTDGQLPCRPSPPRWHPTTKASV